MVRINERREEGFCALSLETLIIQISVCYNLELHNAITLNGNVILYEAKLCMFYNV